MATQVKSKPSISKFEEYLLYFITLFIPIVTIGPITYEYSTQKYAFFTILIFILFFAVIMEFRRQKQVNINIPLPAIGWGLFTLATALSLISVMIENFPYLRFSGMWVLYFAMTFLFVVYLVNRIKDKRIMINILGMLLISAGFIVLDSFLNFYAGWDIWLGHIGTPYMRDNVRATIGNPDFVPDYLGVLLFVAVYFISSRTLGYDTSKDKDKVYKKLLIIKILATIEAILMVAVIIFSQTRGVFIAIPLSVVFLALLYTYYQNFRVKKEESKIDDVGKKLKKLSTTLLVIFVIAVFVEMFLYSIPGPFTGNAFSLTGRVTSSAQALSNAGTAQQRFLAWWASVYQWKDHSIIGQGLGTYRIDFLHYLGVSIEHHPTLMIAWNNFMKAHNDYVQLLGETGLVGILTLVFALGSLLWFVLRVLKKKDSDDALLMMLISAGSMVTLITSMYSFAEHLMPDSMTLTILLAFLVSDYFNKDGDLTWKIVLNKTKFAISSFVSLVISAGVMILMNMYFVSEVYFLYGNTNYQYISAYQNAASQANNQLNTVQNEINQLKSYSGNYAYLNPQTYIQSRIQQFLAANPGLNQTQASIQLESQRQQEYNQIMNQLNSNLQSIQTAINQFNDYENQSYIGAKDDFLNSVRWDNTYGTSEFYLGLLATFPQRDQEIINELNKALASGSTSAQLNVLKDLFYGQNDITQFIHSRFKNLNYKGDYDLIASMVNSGIPLVELWNSLNINQLVQMQMYQDGIDYLKTSLRFFAEKNSYRLIGQFSALLSSMNRSQASIYQDAISKYPKFKSQFEALIQKHEELAQQAFVQMENWYDQLIFILPGGWNRYSGWNHVYSEYINNILQNAPLDATTYAKIKEIAQKYVWAGYYMQKTFWAIPTNTMGIFTSLAQNFINNHMYSEALTTVNDTLSIFKPAYEWNVADLERYKGDTTIYNNAQDFINQYKELETKRVQFLSQLKAVYEYAFTNPTQKATAEEYIKDWNHNILTNVTTNDSTSDIISAITKMLSETK
ncbi:MAG: O-antigen ligase family protein [Athalassotoga sp.]|uniref:O-antigen ligase family protein n=1 Tax=Athalassotoga sp. TaxID=2022597 RepID=UPI003D02D773